MNYLQKSKEELIVDLQQLEGDIIALKNTFQNYINALKQKETNGLKREERFRFALEGTTNGLWDWDIANNRVYYSKQWRAMYGFTETEIGETLEESSNRAHPDDKESIFNHLDSHLKGLTSSFSCEHRVICKDGSYKWVLDEGKIVTWDHQGNPLHLIGTHQDITLRKNNEFALNKRLKELNCHNQISEIMSRSAISIDEVIESMLQIIPQGFQYTDNAEVFVTIYDKVFKTNGFKASAHSIIQNISTSEKTLGWIELSYCNIQSPDSAHIFLPEEYNLLFSIAERLANLIKKNEKGTALENSKEKYRNLIEEINDAIYEIDENGFIKYISPAIEKIMGYVPAEITGKNISDFTGESLEIIRNKLTNSQDDQEYDYEILSKTGKPCWIRISTKAKYEGNQLKGGTGILIDITEKKMIELALQKREAQYKSILETSPDTITITDLKGIILFTSPNALKMYGYEDFNKVIGRSLLEFVVEEDRERALKNIDNFYHNKFFGSKEYKGLRSDGSTFDIEVNGEFIRNEANEPVNLLFIGRDISDRKLAEEKLIKSEETYRELVENIKEVIYEITDEGIITFLSPAIERVTGYKPAELVGQNFLTHIYNEDLSILKERIKSSATQDFTSLEYRYTIKNGEVRWVQSASRIMYDKEGKYIGRRGSFTDTTDRKQSEDALQKSEERLREIVEQTQTVIWEVDVNGLYTYVSPASETTWGFSPDELVNKKHFYDLAPTEVHGDFKQIAMDSFTQKRSFKNFENKIVTKGGRVIWVSTNGIPILDDQQNLLGYRGADTDITERKLAKERLVQSANTLNYAQKIAQMGSWELDMITQKITWSKYQYELLGLQPFEQEIDHKYFINNVHPDDVELVRQNVANIHKNKKATSIDLRFIMPDKKCKWLRNNTEPVFDGDKLIALRGVDIDITEIRQQQEEIKQQNERLNAIINAMPDLIFVINKEGRYLEFHRSSTEKLTVADDQIVGANIKDIFNIETAKYHLQKINQCISDQTLLTYDYSMNLDNITCYYEARLVPIGSEKILSFVRDITERKQQENELKKLSQAVLQSPVSIAITDLNANIEYINPAFEASTGYSMSELIGRNMSLLQSGKTGKSVYKNLWETVTAGNTWQTEWMNKKKNGQIYWESISINPIKNAGGEITNYLTVKQDITERKQSATILQQSEEKYRNIFVNNPQPIYIYDLETLAFLEVNNAAVQHYGYSRNEFLSMHITEIRPREDINALKKYVTKNMQAYDVASEWRHTKKTGEIIHVEIVTHTLTYNQRKARQVIVNDVTEKKNAEKKILELNINLELKIAERTIQMAEINSNLLQEIDDRKQIEKALSKSKNSYETVVNNVTEIIFQTDATGLWVFLNNAWEEVTGFTTEESLGKLFVNYVHPDDRQRNMDLFAPLINREKDYCRHQVRYLTKNGGFRWVEVFARLGLNEMDEITGTYGTLQDITERKLAEEALQQKTNELENFFTVALDLLCITDATGNFKKVNKAWEVILGYSVTELEQKNFLEFVHPDDLAPTLDAMNELSEQKPILNFTNRYKTKKGGYRFIEWHSVPVGDLIYAAARDITNRKEAEEAIKLARREAEQANLAKSEFLSRMSHELRTPLNSILGFAQLLEMGQLNAGQTKGVKHILHSGNHLLDLINEVLDIASIEAGKISLSPERVQLDEVIREMVDIVHPLTYTLQLTINVVKNQPGNLFIKTDRQRLKQVLINLFNNAIKYNQPGGKIFITTELHQDNIADLPNIRISIKDTGKGISAEDIPKLFKSFERIGADKTNTEGTGLGLAVVKKLMTAMNGNVGLMSKPGEGSTFWIEFPACIECIGGADTEIEKTDLQSSVDQDGEYTGTILYMEDNNSNIELVEEIISTYRPGIRLITNMYGMQTVNLSIDYKPDLILLDLNLPDIHGSEVMQLLKSKEKTKDIPVIFVSADAMPDQIKKLLENGAKNYLTKPIDVVKFLSLVDEVILNTPSNRN